MNYSDEQIKILENKSNYMQVIAAAGSGKTSTMIGLLEKIILDRKETQENILVITFTRKATAELKERLEKRVGKTEIRIHTFHAYCLYILQKYKPEFKNTNVQIITDEEKKNIFKEYFKKERFRIGGIPYDLILSSNDNFMKTFFPDIYEEVILIYKEYKTKNKKLDFDDLIEIYLLALEENLDWAIEARQEVKRVIVDEFQDTDFKQLKWLQLLKPEKLSIVGDDWQAIYGFRGASTEPFLEFPKYFIPCNIFFLTTNYRSYPNIIQTSAIPISKNKKNIPKKVQASRKGKGNVSRLILETEENLLTFVQAVIHSKTETKVLCRSNYRIAYFKKLGIDESQILTIHSSKGLEFETVILDLVSGWNLNTNEMKDIIEEERRILYVGLSRAKNNLYILGEKTKSKERLEDEFFSYFKKISNLNIEKFSC